MKSIIIPIVLLFLICCSDKKKSEDKTYIAGFRTIQAIDKTRVYKPNSDTTDYLHFRPLDLDVWYPANPSKKKTPVLFRDILGLFEKRINFYISSDAGNGMTQKLAQYLCEGLKCSDSSKLLNYRTESFINAVPVKAKFPLVIYLAAFNGMSYENFTLFEELAKKGFVVVSINSIGRFPVDMTMKYDDLLEQVNDAIASINILRGSSNIDFTKVGIIG